MQNITKAIFILTLILNLTGSLVAASFFKRLKLKNPGFESYEKIEGRATASCWVGYGCPQPFRLTRDAYKGKTAFRLKGRGMIYQRVKLDAEDIGHPLSIHLYAKGIGELSVFFKLIGKNKEGKDFLTYSNWEGRHSSFLLIRKFISYSFTIKKIPAKTIAVEVYFGYWGLSDATFDNIEIFVGKPKKQKEEIKVKIPDNLKFVDIAPFAKIRTNPYGMLVKRMVDGIPHTGLTLEKHPSIKAKSYEFIYKQIQRIAKIRFTLPAKSFVLLADTNGNGKYDKILTREEYFNAPGYGNQKDWQWYEKSFWPPVRAKAIKLVTFKGNNAIFEFQIFSPQKYISKKFKELLLPVVDNKNIPFLTKGEKILVSEPKNQQRYLQGFHIEPWMYKLPGWLRKKPRPPLKDWPPFQKMIKEFKRMHCSLVWLFPPKTWEGVKGRPSKGYPYDVMWPSKYFKWSYPENLLKEFTGEMHKAGIKVFVQWRFPHWEKDIKLPANKKELPLSGNYYSFIYCKVAEELIDAGVDGIPLCRDEAYFLSIRRPLRFAKDFDLTKAKDDPEKKKWVRQNAINKATRGAFKKRWHTDKFPEKFKGSNYRKWVIFYYEQIAKALYRIVKTAKKKNPNVLTVTNLIAYERFNNRMRWGAAYDIIANIAKVDYLGTDPYHTMEDNSFSYLKSGATSKALSAGNVNTQSLVTLNFPWGWKGRDKQPLTYEVCPPISVMGSVVNSLMQGGTAFAFWRYNLSFFEGYDKYIEQVYGMLDTMAAWGAKEAKIPRNIAVLRSRASEDWWQLKVRSGDYKGNPGDEIQGYVYYKWLAELLMTNGYPFKLYYCDQPETLQKLSDFKLVILPFPYSISKGAYKEIEKAAENGTKVLILGKQGETDEIGDAYAKPLLRKLISSGKAKFVGEKIDQIGHFPEFTEKMLEKIDLLIGDRKTLTFDRCGSAVQVSCLEKSDTEKFIALINWGNSEASVKLGVNLPLENLKKPEKPEIKYQIFIRDLENTCKATINNSDVFSASDLKKFYVKLKKNEIKILYVTDK